MKIIEEAKKRKTELEVELDVIDKLLGLYANPTAKTPANGIAGATTVREACRNGLISRRGKKAIESLLPHAIDDTLANLKQQLVLTPDWEMRVKQIPNCGRFTAETMKGLMERIP